jgi:hypothetical protein
VVAEGHDHDIAVVAGNGGALQAWEGKVEETTDLVLDVNT